MTPDATDWAIMDRLRLGHQPNNEIARQLGLSEGTVRQRLKRLKEAGILEVRALINPEVLDHQQLATIAINVQETRQLATIAEQLAELPRVLSVALVSGRYDVLVEILVDSNRGLVQFVTETLPKVEGIARTESFVVLRSYRRWV